ncbi:MAG: hypothetical protein K2L17_08080 [Muribaculaceae bacterium]|nr:hypothetical protein [Muribaculaceae bacterium]
MINSQDNFDSNYDCFDEIRENDNMIRVSHDNTPIKVVGIGGGAANSIEKMIENPYKGVEYCIINNNYVWNYNNLQEKATFMELVPTPSRFGDTPYRCKDTCDTLFYKSYDNDANKMAVYSLIDITTKYVIIVAGFGGIIGTAGTKWLSDICKSLNIPVTVVCTIPFNFEGERKQQRALDAVKTLEKSGITVKAISAEDIIEKHEDFNFFNSFSYLDEHVAEAVREICNRLEETTELYDPD